MSAATPMRIDITITDDRYTADFSGECGGTWGRYTGSRETVNDWMRQPRSRLEARWSDVCEGDVGFDEHFRWIQEECPLIALAVMCSEWGEPR